MFDISSQFNRNKNQGVNGEVKSTKSILVKTGYTKLLLGCNFLCQSLMNHQWVWEVICKRLCIASVRFAILLFCDGLIAVYFVFAYRKLTVSFSTRRRFCLLSASYTIEIRLERSNFGGRHFESVLAARPYLCDVISSDSEWVGRRKLCNGLILNKVSKIVFVFFEAINAIISEFGAYLAQEQSTLSGS